MGEGGLKKRGLLYCSDHEDLSISAHVEYFLRLVCFLPPPPPLLPPPSLPSLPIPIFVASSCSAVLYYKRGIWRGGTFRKAVAIRLSSPSHDSRERQRFETKHASTTDTAPSIDTCGLVAAHAVDFRIALSFTRYLLRLTHRPVVLPL